MLVFLSMEQKNSSDSDSQDDKVKSLAGVRG